MSKPLLSNTLWVFAAASLLGATPASAACVTKAGSATGVTKEFAEYEAFLIIRQVTGNWPIQSDKISAPSYKCKQDSALWTCKAVAKVCKG
jgi:hypothetical protein